jgi:hypothetical protein
VDAHNYIIASGRFYYGGEAGLVAVNHAFRLDLRFLSDKLNRQVKVNGFCDF